MTTKAILIALGVVAALYVLVGLAMFFGQRHLLFHPARETVRPEEVGLAETEDLDVVTQDGERLRGWWLKGEGDRVALFFHGNAGSLANRAARLEHLRSLGLSVLAIDYRGYGRSTGTPSEAGLLRDAAAARALAAARGFDDCRMLYVGESLGSGVALALARAHPPAGVLLDSAYSAIVDIAADLYPYLPVRLLMRDRFDAAASLRAGISAPILMLHGAEDEVVPVAYARRLAAAGGANVRLAEIAGADHIVLDTPEGDRLARDWLAALPSPQKCPAKPIDTRAP